MGGGGGGGAAVCVHVREREKERKRERVWRTWPQQTYEGNTAMSHLKHCAYCQNIKQPRSHTNQSSPPHLAEVQERAGDAHS